MSLKPAIFNFVIYQGATFRQRVTLLSAGIGSPPQDLTGYTAICTIKDKQAGVELMTLSSDDGTIVIGDANGTVDFVIPATDTENIIWDIGYYDLLMTAPSAGDTNVYLLGTFTVIHL